EPWLASTSLCRNDGARCCTTEKNSERKHDCPGCTQSGPGTPADTLGFGIGFRKRDYRPTRVAGYAFSESQFRTLKRSEEHTSELQSLAYLVCRLLLEKKKKKKK